MSSDLPFLDHLTRESARFRDALAQAPLDAEVPSCPGWVTDDLLWHLAEVQWFWGSIVAQDLRTDQQVEDLPEPEKPTDHASLLAFYDQWSPHLAQAAAAAGPQEQRWMWVADKDLHNVDYIRRRQAHEALIHRIDAELTAGLDRAPIDAALATDGVDEAVRVMFGQHPAWGSFSPGQFTVRFETTDTGSTWVAGVGRFTGTPPWADEPTSDSRFAVEPTDDGREVGVTISGAAADLDLWLWGRDEGDDVSSEGDAAALAAVRTVIDSGVR